MARFLFFAVVLGLVFAYDLPKVQAAEEPDVDRLEHLLKAARHLEQAGLAERAAEIRALAAQVPADVRVRLLERKQEDARRLEAELALLRQLPAGAGPQVAVSLRVLEFRPARLREKGLPLLSLEQFVSGDGPSAMVDESGTVVSFLELLEKQNLLTVLCQPKVIAANGQMASLVIGEEGPNIRDGVGVKDGAEVTSRGLTFRCRPEVRDDGKLRLYVSLHYRTEARTDGAVAGPAATGRDKTETTTCIELSPGQTAILGGVARNRDAAEVARLAILKADVLRPQPAPAGRK